MPSTPECSRDDDPISKELEEAAEDDKSSLVLSKFKSSLDLNHFAYSPKAETDKPSPVLRRSSRKPVPVRFKSEGGSTLPTFSDVGTLSQTSRSKRPADSDLNTKTEHSESSRSPKKQKRMYATPDAYAHLSGLHDHLKHELNIVFCGINPGYKSAETGHHYANPTNHFWRCLHQSGLTTRRLHPSEDHTLPDLFSLGLTDLVERPSAEQAELSRSEMTAAVPIFLAKIARYRPRIVCFVGMGIWRIVEKVLLKMAVFPVRGHDAKTTTLKARKERSKSKDTELQPYRLVYDPSQLPTTGDVAQVKQTLFFVVPSTSGRVVDYQLSDKVKLFANLKVVMEDYKSLQIDTSQMATITLSGTSSVL